MTRRTCCKILLVFAAIFGVLVFSSVLSARGNRKNGFEHVRDVQERHTDRLMEMDGVEGTGIWYNQNDRLTVKVFAARPRVGGIPQELEGVPVQVVVTGKIYALPKGRKSRRSGRSPKPNADPPADKPALWCERPVPIGVSTGHPDITAGTIACRVTDGTNVYALSNNHVYANENRASLDDNVLQPGAYDSGVDPDDAIGTLAAFESIVFSRRARNELDAAIALSSTVNLGTATPAGGYGTPSSETATAFVGMAVQKYGRTTGMTSGEITAINATVNVGYSRGTARFVKQIIVESGTPFIGGGDSGSLLVTDDSGLNPVGLLFAGTGDGLLAVANPIDLVLDRFGVTVDDTTAGEPLELVSIAVTPATASIPQGLTQQYSATGTYSDDSTADITTDVTWISSVTSVATINSSGLATGEGDGTSIITATLGTVISNEAGLTVKAPILVYISVKPETASMEVNSTQQYSAAGIYSDWNEVDITTTVDWTSSNTGAATINATGLATGVVKGTSIITATLDTVISNEAQLTVTLPPPTLNSITVTPVDASIFVGSTKQYSATGTYSDTSTADITNDVAWVSSDIGVATIDALGLATGIGVATTEITASLGSTPSNIATLTVTEVPSEIEVFSDSFESSADWTANWSQDSQNDWRRRTSRKKEGNYAAEVDGRATDAQLISIPIDLQGKTNATVTFWWYIESGLDTGEYLAFDVSTDGGDNWPEMASLNGNVDVDPENTWHNESINVTGISNLRIRFRGTMSSSIEDAYVDVVKVVAW